MLTRSFPSLESYWNIAFGPAIRGLYLLLAAIALLIAPLFAGGAVAVAPNSNGTAWHSPQSELIFEEMVSFHHTS
jgi:hypothetical protein